MLPAGSIVGALLKLLAKLLLLHLVGCLCYCTNDARSQRHQILSTINQTFIPYSVLGQVHSFCQSDSPFLPSIYSIVSFPWSHPVAAYVFILLFPSLLFFLRSLQLYFVSPVFEFPWFFPRKKPRWLQRRPGNVPPKDRACSAGALILRYTRLHHVTESPYIHT